MAEKNYPNTLSLALDASEEKAKLDTNAKYLVANRDILATILRWCVPEFSRMEREEERMENMGDLGDGIERRALEKGKEQGIGIGREQGRNLQKIETAVRMDRKGVTVDLIASFLDITEEEVKEILGEKKSDNFQ